MKRLFVLTLSSVMLSICGFAQTASESAFTTKLQEYVKARQSDNYAEAERLAKDLLVAFYDLDEERRNQSVEHIIYYDIACLQSLQGETEAAVKSFAEACRKGFDNYRHVLTDTDLDNIRNNAEFVRLHAAMRETSDFVYILQKAPAYLCKEQSDRLPHFTYMDAGDPDLVRVREYFKLDSVAGTGDELSKIKRLLTFVHDKIRHDGNNENPRPMTSIALAEACKDGSRGLNCRGLATVLNDCYLSMGFKSRLVTCMPKIYIMDCHAINCVWSETLGKWLWVDPTNNAWVTDEEGTMLSIAEVRERLRDGRQVVLNAEANWNNERRISKEEYLDNYMAKNLYWINCPERSEFGAEVAVEGKERTKYLALYPLGFVPEYKSAADMIATSDDVWFWQRP